MKNEIEKKNVTATDGKTMLDEVIKFLDKAIDESVSQRNEFYLKDMDFSAACSEAMMHAYKNVRRFIVDFI